MARQPRTFELRGVKELIRGLQNDTNKFQKFCKDAVNTTAISIERKAKSTVQVDTGFLKDNIKRDIQSDLEQTVTANTEYASYVEYGTSKNMAYPYMNPAADYAEENMHRMILTALKKSLY